MRRERLEEGGVRESKEILWWLGISLGLIAASCGAPQERASVDDAAQGVVIDEVVLTTGTDPVTRAPTGTTGSRFSALTPELYACLRLRSGAPGTGVQVAWTREGAEAPIFTSRLIVNRGRWQVATLDTLGALQPGRYIVRFSVGAESLTEAGFEIVNALPGTRRSGGGGGPLLVTRLRFVSELDAEGHPRGELVNILPAGTRRIYGAFLLSNAAPGVEVAVRWIRGSDVVRTSELGVRRADGEVVTAFESAEPLPAGLYRADVVVNGVVARRGPFIVNEEPGTGEVGPRVANLSLTTAVEPRTGLPIAPVAFMIRGDEPVLYASMTFLRVPRDQIVEVRWFRDSEADEPLASRQFIISGRGSLAASFAPGEPLPAGAYHIDVVMNDRLAATFPFEVESQP